MSAYEHIGRSLSRAELAIARALGVTIEFKHRDEACVELKAMTRDSEVSVVEAAGIQRAEHVRTFVVARQDGFGDEDDHEPVIPGDRITYRNVHYWVLESGITKRANSGIYEIRCVRKKRLASGVS